MYRRQHATNIPIEVIRTVVVIAEAGSFSKAGEKLGLTQPAISAQIKRLQILVGGPVFERVSGGVELTPRGDLVLQQCRNILQISDQMLALAGADKGNRSIRIGISPLYVEEFLASSRRTASGDRLDGIEAGRHYVCSPSHELAQGLIDRYIDAAILLSPPESGERLMAWSENLAWVRGPDFVLQAGLSIPLVTAPGTVIDSPMVQALAGAGIAYRVVFASTDHHTRRAAVAAGMGYMILPRSRIPETLVFANDSFLPELLPVNAAIVLRPGADAAIKEAALALLSHLGPGKAN